MESTLGSIGLSIDCENLEIGLPLSHKYLLVVDDDEDQRVVYKALLEHGTGCKVITAESAAQAVEYLKEIHFDLVVCDINMPEVSGAELVSRLRARPDQGHLPIISFSADNTLNKKEMMSYGADDFCYKSKSKELLASISKLLEKSQASQDLLSQVQQRFV